jgi:hypothetical protein
MGQPHHINIAGHAGKLRMRCQHQRELARLEWWLTPFPTNTSALVATIISESVELSEGRQAVCKVRTNSSVDACFLPCQIQIDATYDLVPPFIQ